MTASSKPYAPAHRVKVDRITRIVSDKLFNTDRWLKSGGRVQVDELRPLITGVASKPVFHFQSVPGKQIPPESEGMFRDIDLLGSQIRIPFPDVHPIEPIIRGPLIRLIPPADKIRACRNLFPMFDRDDRS